jgi:L-ascorbate metabolism protein UlaG (beta-lactamase superfamily)
MLASLGIGPVHELDWGETWKADRTAIHCVPALNFSARNLFDRNRTLWCGYVIEYQNRTVYFAGDTAFGAHFQHIRARFGPPSLALLPIGSFEPRWFMSPVHMAPDEAVKAHEILGPHTSIAIHHGTFQLGDDGIDKAKRELLQCAAGASFLVLNNGESATVAE